MKKSKTKGGKDRAPGLPPLCMLVLQRRREEAIRLGIYAPEHYVFPYFNTSPARKKENRQLVLNEFADGQWHPTPHVAEAMGIHPHTVQRIIKGLVAEGMLLRDATREDRRGYRVRHRAPEPFEKVDLKRTPYIDPIRPMSTWKNAWQKLLKTANFVDEKGQSIRFRFYDARHTVATQLLEKGVPDAVVQAQIGQIDPGVLKEYSQIRRRMLDDVAKLLLPDPEAQQSKEPDTGNATVQ